MSQLILAPVVKRQVPAPGHVELWVHSPVLAGATPGQFAHVVTQGTLRRPISFSRLDVDTGNAAMLFQVVGVGTRWLANQEMGAVLDILGPLGRGFPVPDARRPWCLVGGGVGIPPLFAAASQWTSAARMTPTAILGARTESLVLLEEEFRQLGHVVWITTDDGSRGMKGTVIGPLARWLAKNPQGQVYACGPTAMLRAVGAISGQRDDVWMALEQRMGCGVGACLACVVLGNGPEGPDYRRVCTEGPVFSGEELIFP